MSFDVFDDGTLALDGKAIRRQVTIYFSKDKSGTKMDLLLYLPAGAKKPDYGGLAAGQDRVMGGRSRYPLRHGDRQLLGPGGCGAEPAQLRRDYRSPACPAPGRQSHPGMLA